jgi:hypothetical protein
MEGRMSINEQGLPSIVRDIELVALDAAQRLPPPILKQVLAFLTKVAHVLDQAYRDLLSILIDIKHLEASDLQDTTLTALRKRLDLVASTSHYRDAEEICSRLKTLKETYLNELQGYIDPNRKYEWSGLFGIIEDREGRIIMLIRDQLAQLNKEMAQVNSSTDLMSIRELASSHIDTIKRDLNELNTFTNKILGLSGNAGLLEMLRDPNATPQTVISSLKISHDQYTYTTTGHHSPIITGHHVTFDTSHSNNVNIDLKQLANDLADLRREMKRLSNGTAEQDAVLGEVAKAETAARSGDRDGVIQAMKRAGKWAFDVAEKVGVGVAIAVLKPLVTGVP